MAVNPLTVFCGKPMSEAIGDMNAYIQLSDEVFYQILQYTGDEIPIEIEKVYRQLCFCLFKLTVCLQVQLTYMYTSL